MRLVLASLFSLGLLLVGEGASRAQIKGRVMVVLDTSGSMGFYFRDPTKFDVPSKGGDYPGGDGSFSYTDRNLTNSFMYPGQAKGTCTQANMSGCEGLKSRMYAAKNALSNAVNGYGGDIDFGLATFDFQLCAYNSPLCEQCAIQCMGPSCSYSCLYTDNAFTKLVATNWQSQSCGNADAGARIISIPGVTVLGKDSGAQILPWIDGIEDHRTSGDSNNNYGIGSTPLNPEIRAEGGTPLAESLNAVRTRWYDAVKGSDAQLNCRPYAVVLATDGVQSVGGTCGADPVAAAAAIYNANTTNRVKVYVIGVATGPGAQAPLDAIAAAGGTGKSKQANSQAEIESAFADIAAASVKFELCNNIDDNCNAVTDEGFDKGASCTVGNGPCQRTGMKKCTSNGQGTQCCVNDGNANGPCVLLTAGAGSTEICNGVDDDCNGIVDDPPVCATCNPSAEVCDGRDNDCDKVTDNNPVDVGKPCGFNIGLCTPGTTVCTNGALLCQGGVMPVLEKCDGLDNDCDGVTDGMLRGCYSGPNGTSGVGNCRPGQQVCTSVKGSGIETWGPCVGEVIPSVEICNGFDDDCNNKVDDVIGGGGMCCPSGMCGTGVCTSGSLQCSGGNLACIGATGPSPEICDNLDNDCNGITDDVPAKGQTCKTQGGCAGMLVCNTVTKMLVCMTNGTQNLEVCNGIDDDCDGQIDEEPDVTNNDPRIGVKCGDMTLKAPCMAGTTICKNGAVSCEGAVLPMNEICDGRDNDCDGLVDNNAPCPTGYDCYMGGCYAHCSGGEFPCPGGYTCDKGNYCVPDACQCKACERCDQNVCVDTCTGNNCPAGTKCQCGACVDDTCLTKGCPSGERCETATRMCVVDPCVTVTCGPTEFCDKDGKCVKTCVGVVCNEPLHCDRGTCVDDKCAKVGCPGGQICDPSLGSCVTDPCYPVHCLTGQLCVKGTCTVDPCDNVKCPTGLTCTANTFDGTVRCEQKGTPGPGPVKDQIVAGGGGGFSCNCAVGGGSGGDSSSGFALLSLIIAGLGWRRRRQS